MCLPRPARGPFLKSLGSILLAVFTLKTEILMNSFEIQTTKLPGSEREWTDFGAKTRTSIPLV